MTDIGFSLFLSKKVQTFRSKKFMNASILGRLWQNNLGTILLTTSSIIPISPEFWILDSGSYPYQKTFHTQTLIRACGLNIKVFTDKGCSIFFVSKSISFLAARAA
ncbi:MAG: hypothetical protein F6K54_01985 [Okeania sp. SIO3B5]|uniref:hypothetical protein n=1 Tax=Okeania sp. SIO3B5 TaxID=2607811 RepID=UPI0014014283|nr:hypothetical protein [Okeania sp. SIO3B5]NEO51967.1 hypothetical protein [Okeania sp. SIO3B5]